MNHEYTDGGAMFASYQPEEPTRLQVEVELAAHGGSVVELRREAGGRWSYVKGGRSRRVTASTPMTLSGPAAGHPLLRTSADPTGTRVLGMLNNCGGGTTPWGTVLTAEENFDAYFAAPDEVEDPRLRASYQRYGVPVGASQRRWERFDPRFDLAREPNEVNRFGWIVEIDPRDPRSTPVKRTALGRFKHEAATVVLARDGRAVVYSGDDERFEYAYKFVSEGRHDARHPERSADLLHAGTLHAARFDDDGTGEWMPLRHADPRLAPAFDSQAEVLIRAREAADRLGATKMDRPEDIETNPVNGLVYMALTNNPSRVERAPDDRPGTGTNAANPRPDNQYGHILELREDGGDPAATTFAWSIFMLCGPRGDPSRAFAGFPPDEVSDIAAPDNLAFDGAGNMWIATDGQPRALRHNDCLQAVATAGPERGRVLNFLTAPPGAEVAGPCLTPEDDALLVAVQHPGEGGSVAEPRSRWPDGRGFARPSVVVVSREDGGRIGS